MHGNSHPLLPHRNVLPFAQGVLLTALMGLFSVVQTVRATDSTALIEVSTEATFTLLSARVVDLDGKLHILGEGRPPKPVVLVFIGPDCPIVRRSVEPLNEMAMGQDKMQFFGVISSPDVGRAEAVKFRDEFRVEFPIILDSVGDLALRLQPTTVPEAFVIAGNGEMLYRGAIDDRFASPGRPRKHASAHYLRDAMEAVAVGTKPEIRATEPVGCLFEPWDPKRLPDRITYHQHIAPIVNANCVKCHREGQSAPFALTDYSLVRRKAKMIAWVCEEKIMPPWSAKAGFNHFVDQRVLDQRQIDALTQWAHSEAEEGDHRAAYPLPVFPVADEWPLGDPDLVLQVPEPFRVPANGEDVYRHFIIPTGLTDDKQLVAMDFRPGEPEVVHHVIFYRDPTGKARKLSGKDGRPGYDAFSKEARSKLVDRWGWSGRLLSILIVIKESLRTKIDLFCKLFDRVI
ncbi:MAG: hypothetical protein AAF357_04255 [Verrucomicrobiota bacterium]